MLSFAAYPLKCREPVENQLLIYLYCSCKCESFQIDIVTNEFHLIMFFFSFPDNLLPNPRVLALVLFSVANVLSFARIAYILPASETFGQLQISYGRMLQDVFKFICIYFTVMIAFICGLTSLYSYSGESNFKEWVLLLLSNFIFSFFFISPHNPNKTQFWNLKKKERNKTAKPNFPI